MPTPPPPDGATVTLFEVFVSLLIGGLSWVVRYFCSHEKHTLGFILRRTATAGLTSVIVGLATKGYFSSDALAFAAAGAAGYASPEAVDLLLSTLRKYAAKGKTPTKGD